MDGFKKDLKALLNKYSWDKACETSDYILADYIERCLYNYCSTIRHTIAHHNLTKLEDDVSVKEEEKWYYPSKGEYPPKGKQILAYAWSVHNVLAKYDTFDGEDKFVTFDAYNGFIEIKKVIRWQYIIPPKE